MKVHVSALQNIFVQKDKVFFFLCKALPLFTLMWVSGLVSTDYKKVNAFSTEARLVPGSCTCVRAAFYRVAVIFIDDDNVLLIFH